ncbi:hypothetical protein BZA70DRAFT_285188 [Myxozyma melibiosi]|uniref:Uncharacterized protein n=1 Tax=Myxozyma melibiosi TaxID=54550 RepID=A0ABR1EZ17_9ASCO
MPASSSGQRSPSSSSSSSFSARSSTSSSFSARSSASSVSSYATSDIAKDLSPIYPPSSSSSRERADLFPQPTLFDLSIPILPDPSPISDPSFFIDDIKPASPRIRHHPHRRHSHRSSSPDLLRYHHHNSLQQQQLQLQQQQQQQQQLQQQPPLSDSSVGVVAATASSSSAVRVQFREDMLFGADGCIDDDDTIDAKIRAFKFSRDPESDYDADYDDDADSEPEAAAPAPHPATTAPHLHREKISTRTPVKLSPIDTLFPDSLPSFHPTSNPPLHDPSYPPLQDLSLRDHIVQRLQQPPPLTTSSVSASASASASTFAKPISDLFPAPLPPSPLVQHPADHLSQLRKAESADILVSPLSDPGRHPHISLHSQLSNSSSPPPSSQH